MLIRIFTPQPKGCQTIVCIHGGQMDGQVGAAGKSLSRLYLRYRKV